MTAEVMAWLVEIHYASYESLTVESFSKVTKELKEKFGAELANSLLNVVVKKYDAKEPLPFELVLGIIEKMYVNYEKQQDNSVKLIDFAQDLFSLSLIYTKVSEDVNRIWNSDFTPFFSGETLRILNLSQNKSQSPLSRGVNRLERLKLKELNYSVEVSLNAILGIVERQKSPELLDSMIHYFSLSKLYSFPYIVENNDKFAKFTLELHQLKYKLEREKLAAKQTGLNQQLLFVQNIAQSYETLAIKPTTTLKHGADYHPGFHKPNVPAGTKKVGETKEHLGKYVI